MNLARVRNHLLLGGALLALATTHAMAQHIYDGNILWDNYKSGTLLNLERTGQPAGFGAQQLYFQFAHNDSINPQLGNPYSKTAPNFQPAAGSPANGAVDDVARVVVYARECDAQSCPTLPDFAKVEEVCYRGAVAPAPAADWTQGWTYYNDTGAGRTDINYGKPLVIVSGHITSNTTWSASNNYLLRGRVDVDSLKTLTIQPGTVIFGEKATGPSFLCVNMGAKLIAVGTPAQPIIMTSDQAPGSMHAGDWGGLVLNGLAIANCEDCLNGHSHCLTEGTTTYHCGNNDCDSSGDIRYLRSEYAGYQLSPNNELNSITFCSCGVNTRAEYLESFRGLDDAFEWFGGKVTVKHVIGIGGGDDYCDWQMGFRGTVQFLIGQNWGDGGADKGIEADNNEFNFNATCRSNPIIANCTFVCVDHTTGTATNGANLRRGTDAQIYNCIFQGWKSTALNLQQNETAARGFYPAVGAVCGPNSSVDDGDIAAALTVRAISPARSSAMFFVNVPQAGATRIGVYDVNGREVYADQRNLNAGVQTLSWNANGAAAGAYYYRVESAGQSANGKITIVH